MNLTEFTGLQAFHGKQIVYIDANGCWGFEISPQLNTEGVERAKRLIELYGEKSKNKDVFVCHRDDTIYSITVKDFSCIDQFMDDFISEYVGSNSRTADDDWFL